jgi:hypothetical protein
MFRQKVQYKNSKTGTSLIRESEAAQADSLYHISGTQYTWSCVRYIFIFIPSDKSRNEAFDRQPSLSHLCTPTVMNSIKWRCTCMQTLELYGRTTFPAPFFQCSTLILYNRSCMLMMTGQLVGPQKGHIASLWRYGGRQPPSSECRPSSSGLSDQHMRSHQAHHIWPWHWSCTWLSQESMGPHNTP